MSTTTHRAKNNPPAPENIQPENNNSDVKIAVPVNGGTPIEEKPDAIAAYEKQAEPADETAFALKHQIDALRHSEALQRQRMEQEQQARLARQAQLADMRPLSRQEKIAAWRQGGLTEANEKFLLANPEL